MALQKDQIIGAAIELLDEGGLEAVSLRKLAAKLGVQAPALYWHVKNKEALTDEMADFILAAEFPVFKTRQDSQTWQEYLKDMMRRLRRAMWSHRDGARVVAGAHLYPAPSLARFFETCLASLHSAGLSYAEAMTVCSTATHFTFGRVIEEQSGPTKEQVESFLSPEGLAKFKDDFPATAEVLKHGDFTLQGADMKFEASLDLIIGGPGCTF